MPTDQSVENQIQDLRDLVNEKDAMIASLNDQLVRRMSELDILKTTLDDANRRANQATAEASAARSAASDANRRASVAVTEAEKARELALLQVRKEAEIRWERIVDTTNAYIRSIKPQIEESLWQ